MAQHEVVKIYNEYADNVTDGDLVAAAILTLATILYGEEEVEHPDLGGEKPE